MKIKTKISVISIILVLAIGYLTIPVGAQSISLTPLQLSNSKAINQYGEATQSNTLSELVLDDSTTLKITTQPTGNSNFVSPLSNTLTEFQLALEYDTFGLLAHNYLAGRYFFQILPGQEIKLVYSDNRTATFKVTQIKKYQALSPNSPVSDFTDLATGEYLTASQLFRKMYGDHSGHLILQTCIYANQNPTWGRLFVVAEPMTVENQ